ncbi:MAG: GvpL/GvpF family gas vesicle protein [Pseudomonadota bacterium]
MMSVPVTSATDAAPLQPLGFMARDAKAGAATMDDVVRASGIEGVRIITAGDFWVIAQRRAGAGLARIARLRAAVDRRRVFEALLSHGTILAVDTAAPATSSQALMTLTERYGETLRSGLEDRHGCEEYRLSVLWDPKRAMREALGDEAGAPGTASKGTPATAAARAEARRQAIKTRIAQRLGQDGHRLLDHGTGSIEEVACFTVESHRDTTKALEQTLQAIDEAEEGRLCLRLVGPQPAESFCRAEITAVTQAQHAVVRSIAQRGRRVALRELSADTARAAAFATASRLLAPFLGRNDTCLDEQKLILRLRRHDETADLSATLNRLTSDLAASGDPG